VTREQGRRQVGDPLPGLRTVSSTRDRASYISYPASAGDAIALVLAKIGGNIRQRVA
jgi:hypothetical protein